MFYPKRAIGRGGGFQHSCNSNPGKEYGDIKQEVIDCLIASRSAYELNTEGVEFVLKRKPYDMETSQFDLLLPTEQSSIASIWEKQVFVMVRSSAGYIMVACRGTFSLSDVIADVKVAKLSIGFAKGRAQIGFVERAMNMPLELFVSLLRAGEKLIFTGHSLGGAVSSLAALRVLEAMASVPGHVSIGQEQVRCITFGTAPFANLELAAYANSRYRKNFHHIVSKHDVIPRAHSLLPRFFFPVAKWVVDRMCTRWEVRACKNMIETMTKMSVDKAVLKLEEKLPFLWPATWFYIFFKECSAYDEEALCYGHIGYLLLLDPDIKDPESSIIMDEMESLDLNFCVEDKSALEIYYEHGLENHYSCLVRALSIMAATNNSSINTASIVQRSDLRPLNNELHGINSCTESIASKFKAHPTSADVKTIYVRNDLYWTMQQVLRNPLRACCIHVNQILLRLTGNDFPRRKSKVGRS